MQEIRNGVNVHRSLPKVLRINRTKGTELSRTMAYSSDMVSKWSRGVAPLHFENLVEMIKHFDKPTMLIVDYMNKATHLFPPIADGPKFRKNPDTVANQLKVEINEAIESLNNSMDEFMTDGKVEDLTDPKEAINQTLDVVMLAITLMATIEINYGLSIQELEQQREKVWKMKGYLKRED